MKTAEPPKNNDRLKDLSLGIASNTPNQILAKKLIQKRKLTNFAIMPQH